MKVLALASQVLAYDLKKVFFSPKTQATWLLFVYALLTFTVSNSSLPFLVQECFKDCELDVGCEIIRVCEVRAAV